MLETLRVFLILIRGGQNGLVQTDQMLERSHSDALLRSYDDLDMPAGM